jgi:hypothetical protein
LRAATTVETAGPPVGCAALGAATDGDDAGETANGFSDSFRGELGTAAGTGPTSRARAAGIPGVLGSVDLIDTNASMTAKAMPAEAMIPRLHTEAWTRRDLAARGLSSGAESTSRGSLGCRSTYLPSSTRTSSSRRGAGTRQVGVVDASLSSTTSV